MQHLTLTSGWFVLQDVHDSGEHLGLPAGDDVIGTIGSQLSEWEPLDRLQHLQLVFHDMPYWGRSLRSFNTAPWWYRNEFEASPGAAGTAAVIRFTNVDYYAKVWLNGELLGEHEGYAFPFEFDVSGRLRSDGPNRLVVKVWSPWDSELRDDKWEWRSARVRRRMVKGTYEHDDGFIARDVNPVGIYGTVEVLTGVGIRVGDPVIAYDLDAQSRSAAVRVSGTVSGPDAGAGPVGVDVVAPDGRTVATVDATVAEGTYSAEFALQDLLLWETWDRGVPNLYRVRATAGDAVAETRVGFRRIELVRTDEETTFLLNGRRLYVRGASYFPDVYLSRLDEARARRDLDSAVEAGLNVLRVHVHTQPDFFYDLCDEYGVGVIQDSDFNWDHPDTEEWTELLVAQFSAMVRHLAPHPAVIAWICMNEPGVFVADEYLHVRPGPQLAAAARSIDPTRPIIKGSGMEDDPDSRDSHNYHGSLSGESTQYTDIDGTTERFNTEFGFDAPGPLENLSTTGALFRRIEALVPTLPDLQEYQYRLLKYYLEHYRLQRFQPNSGYVQFMLIDLGPNSYYGVYDWWGAPKRGLDAFRESGQPVAVMLAQSATESSAIWVVNDTPADLGEVEVSWQAATADGTELARGTAVAAVGPDSLVAVAPLALRAGDQPIHVDLVAKRADGATVAENAYRSMFEHPVHPAGHPGRLSEEYGTRLFSAP